MAARDILDTPEAGPAAIRGSALRTGGYALGVLLTVVSASLLVRHLGVVDFGRYATITSIVTIVAGLTEGGINAVAVQTYATEQGAERDDAMRHLFGVRLLFTLAGVAIAVAFAAGAGYGGALVIGTVGAGIGLLIQVTQLLFSVPLQAEMRFGWVAGADVVRAAVIVALVVAGVLVGWGVAPFLWLQIPAALVGLAVTIPLARRRMPFRPAFDRRRAWELLRETVPYAAAVAVNVVYFRVTLVIMSLIATGLETGWFATSFRVVEVVIGVPGLVVSSAFPILARSVRDDAKRFEYASGRLLEISLVLGVWLAVTVVLGAAFAIDVLGGAPQSVPVLRIQGIALAVSFPAVAGGFVLLSLRRTGPMLMATLAGFVVSVSLAFGLVPPLGAQGGALVAPIGEAALAAVVLTAAVRTRPALLEGLRGAPAIFAAGGLTALLLLVPGLPSVAAAIAGIPLYAALLALFRRFPPEVGELLAARRGGSAVR